MGTRLNELKVGEGIDSFFFVASSREGTTRNGSTYLTIELRDATGQRSAKVWRPAEALPTDFDVPGVYRVIGRTDSYRDELQVAVDRLTHYQPTDDEMGELAAASLWTPDTLTGELRNHIATRVRSDVLRRLLLYILDHPDVATRLGTAPAASSNHHAYRSGLAEHSLSMMRVASLIAGHYAAYYPGLVDEDLLIAGCLLHDLGKVWELGGEMATEYTDVGRLVGHIPMGAAFVERAARELGGVPDRLIWELQHLVLSHHGQLDYGSPKRPKTVEAQILHQVDMLDSRVNAFAQIDVDGWTPWHRMFGHPVLTGRSMRAEWAAPVEGEVHEWGPGMRATTTTPEAPAAASAPETPRATKPRSRRAEPKATPADADADATEAEAARPKPAAEAATPPSKAAAPPAPREEPSDLDEVPPPTEEIPSSRNQVSLFDGLD